MSVFGRLLDVLSTQLVRINGSSMEPTLPGGSWVTVNRRAYRWPRKPARFDVVRFENPDKRGHWLVKRVVGLPDEDVRLEAGVLSVDGEVIPEPYLPKLLNDQSLDTGYYRWSPCTNEYVVLGDNRGASTDSRRFGTVGIGAFRGRVGRRLR